MILNSIRLNSKLFKQICRQSLDEECIASLESGTALGIHDNFIRLSMGIENIRDLKKTTACDFRYLNRKFNENP